MHLSTPKKNCRVLLCFLSPPPSPPFEGGREGAARPRGTRGQPQWSPCGPRPPGEMTEEGGRSPTREKFSFFGVFFFRGGGGGGVFVVK